jgi:chromosome segregation ATPase
MDEKRIAEIREAQKQAENIINTLHTERLDYHSEYVPLIESNHDIPWLLDLLEQAQKEIERLKDINSALENDLINANMNLERLTERVEAQRWIPVSERLPEYSPSGTVK